MKSIIVTALTLGLTTSGLTLIGMGVSHARSVGNNQSDIIFCETLASAKVVKEVGEKMPLPKDCITLPKAKWRGVVLTELADYEWLAIPLQDGTYFKGWARSDQLYEVYGPR